MNAYLATTGALFGLLALLNAWNLVLEWSGPRLDLYLTAALGAVAAALSIWEWVLLEKATRGARALN